MRCVFSDLGIDNFAFLAEHYLRARKADLFLSSPGFPGECLSYICVNPVRELIVDGNATPLAVSGFAFSADRPTFGYISYTFGLHLKNIISAKETGGFPFGHLKQYADLITYNHDENKLEVQSEDMAFIDGLAGIIGDTREIRHEPERPDIRGLNFSCSLDKQAYMDGVRRTLEYIRDGYTYQLNLSIRFDSPFREAGLPLLFMHLWRRFPAPFYVWFNSGDYRLISSSPELFLRVRNGRVLSRPIKGTMKFDVPDESLKQRLMNSEKESAELAMIVDLIRNDISLNCAYGSVRVEGHKSVFAVDDMLQMYSDVSGRLKQGKSCLELFFDAFPGGSVTGCPKRKSMEIIEELEPHSRDIYCGSFVIIGDRMNMDSSIAIRTAAFDCRRKMLSVYAGSGIVIDSSPEAEYAETLSKAGKFLFAGKT